MKRILCALLSALLLLTLTACGGKKPAEDPSVQPPVEQPDTPDTPDPPAPSEAEQSLADLRETIRAAGAVLGCAYLGATYGFLYTSVSNAGFIGAMTVLFTPFFEFVVYRKRPDRKLGFALAVCMAGMALLTLNEALRPAPGDIICLLVPTFYAVDLMVTEKAVAKPEVDPIALGVLQTAVAGVVMLGLSLLLETPSLPGSPKVWAAALFLGVFCSGICFVIQSVEQQFTTASHASLIFTLEPVFSAVFAYFLLSERLTVRGYFGAALMLVSLLIMELDVPALLKKDEKAP